jgi:hypothetical protein
MKRLKVTGPVGAEVYILQHELEDMSDEHTTPCDFSLFREYQVLSLKNPGSYDAV